MQSPSLDARSVATRTKPIPSVRSLLALLGVMVWLFGVLAPAPAPGAEIDSVTTRGVALDDGTEAINGIFNQRLREGVANANGGEEDFAAMESGEFCDQERLYAELRKAIFHSFIPRWGLRGYDLDLQLRELLAGKSLSVSLEDSIYGDMDYLEGFSLRVKELSDVVRIDGHLMGLDKIGHFFAEGWEYFERTREEGETLEEVMEWGGRQEAGRFGYLTTGVYSFADLTANFHGWRFWNQILGTRDDPLKGLFANLFAEPYVECEVRLMASLRHRKIVRVWHLSRPFDLSEFVDGAWDEGINCNSYADLTIGDKINTRIDEVFPGFSCPVDPKECVAARERYGQLADNLLHPRCLTATAGT